MVLNWNLKLYSRCSDSWTEMAVEALILMSFSKLLEYVYLFYLSFGNFQIYLVAYNLLRNQFCDFGLNLMTGLDSKNCDISMGLCSKVLAWFLSWSNYHFLDTFCFILILKFHHYKSVTVLPHRNFLKILCRNNALLCKFFLLVLRCIQSIEGVSHFPLSF